MNFVFDEFESEWKIDFEILRRNFSFFVACWNCCLNCCWCWRWKRCCFGSRRVLCCKRFCCCCCWSRSLSLNCFWTKRCRWCRCNWFGWFLSRFRCCRRFRRRCQLLRFCLSLRNCFCRNKNLCWCCRCLFFFSFLRCFLLF
jgi:hypothetical protein